MFPGRLNSNTVEFDANDFSSLFQDYYGRIRYEDSEEGDFEIEDSIIILRHIFGDNSSNNNRGEIHRNESSEPTPNIMDLYREYLELGQLPQRPKAQSVPASNGGRRDVDEGLSYADVIRSRSLYLLPGQNPRGSGFWHRSSAPAAPPPPLPPLPSIPSNLTHTSSLSSPVERLSLWPTAPPRPTQRPPPPPLQQQANSSFVAPALSASASASAPTSSWPFFPFGPSTHPPPPPFSRSTTTPPPDLTPSAPIGPQPAPFGSFSTTPPAPPPPPAFHKQTTRTRRRGDNFWISQESRAGWNARQGQGVDATAGLRRKREALRLNVDGLRNAADKAARTGASSRRRIEALRIKLAALQATKNKLTEFDREKSIEEERLGAIRDCLANGVITMRGNIIESAAAAGPDAASAATSDAAANAADLESEFLQSLLLCVDEAEVERLFNPPAAAAVVASDALSRDVFVGEENSPISAVNMMTEDTNQERRYDDDDDDDDDDDVDRFYVAVEEDEEDEEEDEGQNFFNFLPLFENYLTGIVPFVFGQERGEEREGERGEEREEREGERGEEREEERLELGSFEGVGEAEWNVREVEVERATMGSTEMIVLEDYDVFEVVEEGEGKEEEEKKGKEEEEKEGKEEEQEVIGRSSAQAEILKLEILEEVEAAVKEEAVVLEGSEEEEEIESKMAPSIEETFEAIDTSRKVNEEIKTNQPVAPSLEEVAPSLDEVATSLQAIGPLLEEVTPSLEEIATSLDEVATSLDEVAPSLEAAGSLLDEVAPSSKAVTPSPSPEVLPSLEAVASSLEAIAPLSEAVAPSLYAVAPSVGEVDLDEQEEKTNIDSNRETKSMSTIRVIDALQMEEGNDIDTNDKEAKTTRLAVETSNAAVNASSADDVDETKNKDDDDDDESVRAKEPPLPSVRRRRPQCCCDLA